MCVKCTQYTVERRHEVFWLHKKKAQLLLAPPQICAALRIALRVPSTTYIWFDFTNVFGPQRQTLFISRWKVPDCVEDFLQVLSTHRIHMNLRFIYIEGGTQSFVSKKWFHLQKVSPVVKRSTLPTNDSSLQLSHWNINSHLSLPVRQIFAAYLEFRH